MGKFLFLACLLLIPLTTATADDAEDKYQALLKAAQADPTKADWQALRFAYSETAKFDVSGDAGAAVRKDIYAAFDSGDYATVLGLANKTIAADFVDLLAHRYAAAAYKHLNKMVDYNAEMTIAVGLLKSVETGDGLDPKTPFTVISVNEEYEYLHTRGLNVTQQALVKADGHAYDVMSTADENGKTQDYYFLIDRVLAAEAKQLSPNP
jgi:hypothetical protein